MTGHHGHSDDHHHDHSHSHGAAAAGSGPRLKIALALTSAFMVAEVVGGLVSGSLALLADAGHMLTDAMALALALWAQAQSRRPPDPRRSYGYHRMPVLAAFVNGLALFVIAGWIIVEAMQRLYAPPQVLGGVMLAVAAGGLLVNLLAFLVLHGGGEAHRHDLNLRGAMLHVLGDLLGSVAAIVASLVILATGWMPVDPLLSVLVALLILGTAWRVLRESAHVLLEGSPEGFDPALLASRLPAAIPDVVEVHHVHHWMLTPQRSIMTLHAVLGGDVVDDDRVVRQIKGWVHEHYRVAHVTIQTERGGCADHP